MGDRAMSDSLERSKTASKRQSNATFSHEESTRPEAAVVARAQARTSRLEVRITPADKRLFAQAAAERGMSPSELALSLIRRVTRKVGERARILKYSKRDQEALIASLLEPPKPNSRLRQANKRYKSLFPNE